MKSLYERKRNTKCECGATLYYDMSHYYKEYVTLYFDCTACGKRFSIKYIEETGMEVCRNCIGKSRHHGDRRIKEAKPQTICWDCKNARGNGCSWFTDFTPVEGWEADVCDLYGDVTYTVKKCPEFVPDRGSK